MSSLSDRALPPCRSLSVGWGLLLAGCLLGILSIHEAMVPGPSSASMYWILVFGWCTYGVLWGVGLRGLIQASDRGYPSWKLQLASVLFLLAVLPFGLLALQYLRQVLGA